MADITMCLGETTKYVCPLRVTCLRYKAKPSVRQSWFSKLPINQLEEICSYHWDIEDN